MRWFEALARHAGSGDGYALVTVLATSGSAPRPAGTKMVVTRSEIVDSIGGGQLELQVCERARALLAAGGGTVVQHFPLAAATAQCCGGSVTMLIEAFAPARLDVVVFGAGHVGRRVVGLLEDLDARLTWLDTRADIDPAGRTVCQRFDDPLNAVATLDVGREVLVLTHDHQLDFVLVSELLSRGFASIGLIGSATKWQRFSARLQAAGFEPSQLVRVRCPVGAKLPGKQPMAVAVAIVAELLERAPAEDAARPALSWRQLKESLLQEGAS